MAGRQSREIEDGDAVRYPHSESGIVRRGERVSYRIEMEDWLSAR